MNEVRWRTVEVQTRPIEHWWHRPGRLWGSVRLWASANNVIKTKDNKSAADCAMGSISWRHKRVERRDSEGRKGHPKHFITCRAYICCGKFIPFVTSEGIIGIAIEPESCKDKLKWKLRSRPRLSKTRLANRRQSCILTYYYQSLTILKISKLQEASSVTADNPLRNWFNGMDISSVKRCLPRSGHFRLSSWNYR